MDDLINAVTIWTGYKSALLPTRDAKSREAVLELNDGDKLMAIVEALERDFYKSQAHQPANNLVEMTEIASADFRRLHPELPEVIVIALAWCYSYDWK